MRWLWLLAAACNAPGPHDVMFVDAGVDASAPAQPVTITGTVNSTRFVTREHMLAAGEMQISGEPFAEAMGRDLNAYSRDQLPPNLYNDPELQLVWIDLPGFSTGVESYEYSKQPMNSLAFESGAGTSLVYGPLVDTDNAVGAAATAHLIPLVQHFAAGSNAAGTWVFPAMTYPNGPPAENLLGWPGMWPTTHVFASFDPTTDPTTAFDESCSISSDDDFMNGGFRLKCPDYECDATTLHLRSRATQIDPVITPGADGFSGWKYGLWVLNYLQIMHDVTEAGVATVDAADLANVGTPGNTIVGADSTGAATAAGTYIGSSSIEGFQAQMFLLELDNRAEDWLMHLSTADGATLGGFASRNAALAYDYAVPLRWFPGQIGVTETDDGSGFPHPAYALASADSHALDLLGLAMGYAEVYAVTDTTNADVGGAQTARVFFDGDPFPADDQLADGEATLHDRALAMMRVAMIDLDRLHTDPATGVFADDVAMTGTTAARGHTISTTTVAYAVLGLRTVLRSLSSQLELYSNNTPDTAIAGTLLDGLPIHYPADGTLTFTARLAQLVRAHGDLLLDHLTDATGRAWTGWDLAAATPIDDTDALDAHTAAIRGLFAAFLATGDNRYRDRAIAVFDRMQAVFYDTDARIYTATPTPVDSVEYTPLRFALLQSALRDVYELVASRPGGEALEPVLEQRVARLNKLVLDGWDDRDRDQRVFSSSECIVTGPGLAPHGGLQMAERTLTGETGRTGDEGTSGLPTIDRDDDCVPEVDDAHLPAALADSITLQIIRP